MAIDPDKRIQELHLTLPPAPKPVAVYKPAVKAGNLLFVSGHGPLKPDKTLILGKVGKDLTLDQGKEAARQVGLAILACSIGLLTYFAVSWIWAIRVRWARRRRRAERAPRRAGHAPGPDGEP